MPGVARALHFSLHNPASSRGEGQMNDRSRSDESVVGDEGTVPDGPSDHERRVVRAEQDVTGEAVSPTPGGTTDRFTGSQARPYEDEVEAEREGTTAAEVQQEEQSEPTGEAARWYTG
jgi:hypothetical protein